MPHLGLPPGTMRVSEGSSPTVIHAFGWTPDRWEERTLRSAAEVASFLAAWPVAWINVDGLRDEALLKDLAHTLNLHPLAMEDAVDTSQRAKVEPYGATTFLVVPMPHMEHGFFTEQLSIFLGPSWVVTFQDHPGDCLEPIRDRIRHCRGRVRASGAAYLAYALVDSVIDSYFPIVSQMGEQLEALEERVLHDPQPEQLHEIRSVKGDLMRVRRAVWPMRDLTGVLLTLDQVFTPELRLFVRDANDHVVRLMDLLETDRYMASDLLEIHMTATSNKLGEVNKFLTVIATIFLPLSWIAGIYGMNFKHLPELDWLWGYPFALGLMAAFAAALLFYFWRKGWIDSRFFSVRRPRRGGHPPAA